MVFKLLLVIFFQETLFRGPFRSKVTLLSLVQNIFSLVDESFFRQKINDLIINSYLRTIFKLHVNLSIKQVLQQKKFFFKYEFISVDNTYAQNVVCRVFLIQILKYITVSSFLELIYALLSCGIYCKVGVVVLAILLCEFDKYNL